MQVKKNKIRGIQFVSEVKDTLEVHNKGTMGANDLQFFFKSAWGTNIRS